METPPRNMCLKPPRYRVVTPSKEKLPPRGHVRHHSMTAQRPPGKPPLPASSSKIDVTISNPISNRVGDYVIGDELGRGTYATVRKVQHSKTSTIKDTIPF